MPNIQTVAGNIRNARAFRQYSQDYLAYKLKISQNAYSKIECGKSGVTISRLIDIAKILDIAPMELIRTDPVNNAVENIARIPIVPELLEVICRVTGMGFAAIASVTEYKWTACGVRDEISFGIKPGGELKIETTICNEIRQSREAVIIDHVERDLKFASHPTPAMYGFQSYISMPIMRKDGTFFGTLCAIDQKPAKLNNPGTVGMFKLFADLISFHLNVIETLAFIKESPFNGQQLVELKGRFASIFGYDPSVSVNDLLTSA